LLTGLRQDRVFYLREQSATGFSNLQFLTLTDNLELSPIVLRTASVNNSHLEPLWNRIQSFDASLDLPSEPWVAPLMSIGVWQKSAELKVTAQKIADQLLSSDRNHPIRLINAIARLLNRFADWDRLSRLGRRYQVKDWIAIAERNQVTTERNLVPAKKLTPFENPCLRCLDERTWANFAARKNCHDRHLAQLLEARAESTDNQMKEQQNRRMQWLENENQSFVRLWEWNWALGLPWDLSESRVNESQLWELAMSEPSVASWRATGPAESAH
jgi:hypothetical protein